MAKRNTNSWEGQRPRCPQPPKSSYLKNSTITSVNFHSSKGLSPEAPLKFLPGVPHPKMEQEQAYKHLPLPIMQSSDQAEP